MPKFSVYIERTAHQGKYIYVEAADRVEAEEKALAEAPNHDFSGTESAADYAVG